MPFRLKRSNKSVTNWVLRCILLIFALIFNSKLNAQICSNVVEYLQNISVLIETPTSYASGFLITKSNGNSYVLSAGHSIENIVICTNRGKNKSEFSVSIQKEIHKEVKIYLFGYDKNDFLVSTQKINAKTLFWSDSDLAYDISLFKLNGKNFSTNTTLFYSGDSKEVRIGSKIIYMANAKGVKHINYLNDGILSIKRNFYPNLYEASINGYMGCSGGGVFLNNSELIGMIVSISGEEPGTTYFIPLYEMKKCAKKNNFEWIFSGYSDTNYEEIKELRKEISF